MHQKAVRHWLVVFRQCQRGPGEEERIKLRLATWLAEDRVILLLKQGTCILPKA